MLASPTWEGELCKRSDTAGVTDNVVAIVVTDRSGLERLLFIAADAMVKNNIGIHLYAEALTFFHGSHQLILGSVFGAHGILLVEFAKVVHVVDSVAHVGWPLIAFVGRWKPHGCDAKFRQFTDFVS